MAWASPWDLSPWLRPTSRQAASYARLRPPNYGMTTINSSSPRTAAAIPRSRPSEAGFLPPRRTRRAPRMRHATVTPGADRPSVDNDSSEALEQYGYKAYQLDIAGLNSSHARFRSLRLWRTRTRGVEQRRCEIAGRDPAGGRHRGRPSLAGDTAVSLLFRWFTKNGRGSLPGPFLLSHAVRLLQFADGQMRRSRAATRSFRRRPLDDRFHRRLRAAC